MAAATPPAPVPHTQQLKADCAAIANNPAGLDPIIEFGKAAIDSFNAVANGVIAAQLRFNDRVQEAGDATERVSKAVGRLPAANATSRQHRQLKEDFDTLTKTMQAIEAERNTMAALGAQRLQAAHEMRDYCTAGIAIRDDYAQKYIPGSIDDEEERLLRKRADDLTTRLSILEGARLSSTVSAQGLKMMMQTLDSMVDRLQPLLANVRALHLGPLLDLEEKEAARKAIQAIEAFTKPFTEGTDAPVTVKKPLQFKPKP